MMQTGLGFLAGISARLTGWLEDGLGMELIDLFCYILAVKLSSGFEAGSTGSWASRRRRA